MRRSIGQNRISLRRESDRTGWLIFYCLVGVIILFTKSALANEETCASSMKEMKESKSAGIRSLAEKIEAAGKNGFNNKTRTSHVQFKSPEGPAGKMVFEFHSTTNTDDPENPGKYELADGSAKICDSGDDSLKLVSPAFGALTLSFPEGCFRLHILFTSSARTTFCEGAMPSHISSAREKAGGRGVAIRGLGGSSSNGQGITQ